MRSTIRFWIIFIVLSVGLLFISCDSNHFYSAEATGNLSITISNSTPRIIQPDPLLITVESYRISGLHSDSGTVLAPITSTNTTVFVANLIVGNWTIKVEGLSQTGAVVSSSTQIVNVDSNIITYANFEMIDLVGYGILNIKIGWPVADSSISNVVATLSSTVYGDRQIIGATSDSIEQDDLRIVEKAIADLNTGTYSLAVDFYDNNNVVRRSIQSEQVEIYTNLETKANFILSDYAIKVAAGGFHSAILKFDGSLWTFGQNIHGQLGDGTQTQKMLPVHVMDDVIDVTCGATHTMILKNDNTLWATGNNHYGELGDTTTTDRLLPVQVMTNVKKVSSTGQHTMILLNNGDLYATGYANAGRLGNGEWGGENISSPIKVMENVIDVSAGSGHTVVLKDDGTLMGFGFNPSGQLGLESEDPHDIELTPVIIMDNIAFISANGSSTMLIDTDENLWATGGNWRGQLGDGTTVDKFEPVLIDSDVLSVSAGSSHMLYIKNDGSLYGSGDNRFGALGDGSGIDRYLPIKIMDDVESVSAGIYQSLILKKDGTVWSTGGNTEGQLGDGTKQTRLFPVRIL